MSKNKGKGKSLERRVQDKQRRSQPPSSPSTVFKAPQNQVPTMKEQQETGYYDPDRELTEPERTPIGGWNALTISNAALKARQLFKLGTGLGGFARSLMIRGY
jgi:hypothetical protein